MTLVCIDTLAETLAGGTDPWSLSAAETEALADLARGYLLARDELANSERRRADAERDRGTLLVSLAVQQQHARLESAFAGAMRCVDALASAHDDLDDAVYFARPEPLSTAALLAGGGGR